jgi:hypothetical protein
LAAQEFASVVERASVRPRLFRRRDDGPDLAALLENYAVRAEAIAEAGGGDLWVVEPSVPVDLLPEVAEAVMRHLADNDLFTDGMTVLEGTASARIVVLAAPASDDAQASMTPEIPTEVLLRPAERTLPPLQRSEATLGARVRP